MVRPPGLAERFPAQYMDYVARHPRDHVIGRSTLYGSPLDPGERLGRRGDEDFRTSVLIGWREPMHIILRYREGAGPSDDAWRYAVVSGSESAIFVEFNSLDDLLTHLRAERPLNEPRAGTHQDKRARTKQRKHR